MRKTVSLPRNERRRRPNLYAEILSECKRYHGASSNPQHRATAATVSVKNIPSWEAKIPQRALPRASPPCRTRTYMEIMRARTQDAAVVWATRFKVARVLIQASPAAAAQRHEKPRVWTCTNPNNAAAKINVATVTTVSKESLCLMRASTPAPINAPPPKQASMAPYPLAP